MNIEPEITSKKIEFFNGLAALYLAAGAKVCQQEVGE
jgi:hypothetical protein